MYLQWEAGKKKPNMENPAKIGTPGHSVNISNHFRFDLWHITKIYYTLLHLRSTSLLNSIPLLSKKIHLLNKAWFCNVLKYVHTCMFELTLMLLETHVKIIPVYLPLQYELFHQLLTVEVLVDSDMHTENSLVVEWVSGLHCLIHIYLVWLSSEILQHGLQLRILGLQELHTALNFSLHIIKITPTKTSVIKTII